ncbi:DUF3291 domain-containing protein [Algoriphagus sediminis]|uniref:DUF3291 domain-containing protein n=1 Tax=Algoriphagus sediminis TaxID=3057113 RepID=A0ABT7YCL2_9BACT|nr:DUF3291 domain-containing protein [Algoriphagus sediminis]MDN3203924.1 DUF3291 domain-containing protein [Algoriphagus sediminis]
MPFQSYTPGQICTMSFFRFESRVNKRWAFNQIFKAREPLSNTDGLKFFKLFGLGGGHGYSLKTKFDKYGLLGVWDDMEQAKSFFNGELFAEFKERTIETYTMVMSPLSSRGTWSGFNEWQPKAERTVDNEIVCVLTRATLKPKYIFRFFRQISKVVRDHTGREGLILTQGFSELPLIEQATFSIWENEATMKDFAYRSAHHEVIRMTRKYDGFKEEMYTRMQLIETHGSWNDTDPIKSRMESLSLLAV